MKLYPLSTTLTHFFTFDEKEEERKHEEVNGEK